MYGTENIKENTYYKKNITRTSYCDRVKQLDINFFENLNNKFSKLIDSLFYNNNNKMNIIATDGHILNLNQVQQIIKI